MNPEPKRRPRILGVLLNYRTAAMTLRAAEATLREMEEIAGELVIVDNDSRDGSFRALQDAVRTRGWDAGRRVRVIQSGRNGGFGAGNNVGIRAGLSDGARPDYVYIVNSDAFPDPGAIATLLAFLETHPKAGTAGSHVRGEDGIAHTTLFRFPTAAGEFEAEAKTGLLSRLMKDSIIRLPIPDSPTPVGWSAGASLMLRMDMLDQIGLFDETFFLYFEETELCYRAARAGWARWYVPASRVVHIGSVSTGMKEWDRVPQYFLDSRLHYYTKTHGRGAAIRATLALIAGAMLWRLRCGLSGRTVGGPDRFLSDVIDHARRTLFTRRHRPPMAARLREDRK